MGPAGRATHGGTERDMKHKGYGPGSARDQGPAVRGCPTGRAAPAQARTPGQRWGQRDGDTTLGLSLRETLVLPSDFSTPLLPPGHGKTLK